LKDGTFRIKVVAVEDDYVYYRNNGSGAIEMMPIDYLNRFYVLEK
jgi:hypothetical protein